MYFLGNRILVSELILFHYCYYFLRLFLFFSSFFGETCLKMNDTRPVLSCPGKREEGKMTKIKTSNSLSLSLSLSFFLLPFSFSTQVISSGAEGKPGGRRNRNCHSLPFDSSCLSPSLPSLITHSEPPLARSLARSNGGQCCYFLFLEAE